MAIITKLDFTDNLVRFSQNTPDDLINPDIYDAIRFDLPEVLPYAISSVVLTTPAFVVTDWATGLAYDAGEYARTSLVVDGVLTTKVWKALADNSDSEPTAINTNWQYQDLLTFIDGYVKPYLVLAAYFRYKLEAGIVPTPSGDRIFREDESEPINASQHASQIAKYREKRNDYALLLTGELRRRSYLIDEVQYEIPTTNCTPNPLRRGLITAI